MPTKDRLVFGPLCDHPDPALAARARAHRAALDDLFVRYVSHFEAWPDDRIVAEWPDYSRRTIALIDELADWLTIEQTELLPLLEPGSMAAPIRRLSSRNWAAEAINRKRRAP